MIRHSVLLTLKPNTDKQKLEAIVEEARKLPAEIPTLREVEAGVGANEGNASIGIVALFDDMDGYWEYLKHPAHRSFGQEYIVPVMESGVQVQFEI
jgi:Stress responsive A/B Barrel Domain